MSAPQSIILKPAETNPDAFQQDDVFPLWATVGITFIPKGLWILWTHPLHQLLIYSLNDNLEKHIRLAGLYQIF